FADRWGLNAEPTRTLATAGWALQAWAMARCQAWADQHIRINAVVPAAPDGRLPPAIVAAARAEANAGTDAAARAALFLMSPLSAGITGATLAADHGLSAKISTSLDGL
ncbi:MAG TPA: SDR family oxidoreductase, partial [Paracoccaceae bacterium]|nr:SDR family oxidoreductase [Paracoccaceae bacterium]